MGIKWIMKWMFAIIFTYLIVWGLFTAGIYIYTQDPLDDTRDSTESAKRLTEVVVSGKAFKIINRY